MTRVQRSIRRTAGAFAIALTLFGCSAKPTPSDDAGRRAEVERMFSEIRERYSEVPVIDRPAIASLGERAVLVDVRPEDERAVSTIAGSISKEEYEARPPVEADSVVITYCTVGERSGRYARDLREKGVDARNLEGGILEWTHEGGALIGPGGEPTRRAHVYGPRWSLLPEGYEAVMKE